MESILNNYLNQIATSDSLFIDGEWGAGKTHYIKSKVIIDKADKEKPRLIVYISLNGISSNNELKSVILTKSIIGDDLNSDESVTQKLKSKASNLLSKTGMGQFLLPSFNITDFFEMKNPIFIFDDLERIDPNYSVSNVLAILNSELIENHGFKVVIIGNSKKINKQHDFKIAREKTIGWTIRFKSDFDTSIPSIIFELKSVDEKFYELIKDEQGFILAMIKYFDLYNLRSVKRSLDYLRIIFRVLNAEKLILREIIYFTLVLTNEIRRGKIGPEIKVSELPNFITLNISNYNKNRDHEDIDLTHKEYGHYTANHFLLEDDRKTSYYFFASIFSLIQTGHFDVHQFEEESLKLKQKKESRKKSPELLTIERMRNYCYLSNSEFEQTKKEVFDSIKTGKFDLFEYIRLSRFLIKIQKRFPYLLNTYDIDDFLIRGLEQVKPKRLDDNFYIEEIDRIIGDKTDFSDGLYMKFRQRLDDMVSKKSINRANTLLEKLEYEMLDINYVREIISEVDEMKVANILVSKIEDRGFMDTFLHKISALFNSINAGDFYMREAKKIKKILLNFNELIKGKSFEYIDKVWVEEIQKILSDVVKHIERTKTKK